MLATPEQLKAPLQVIAGPSSASLPSPLAQGALATPPAVPDRAAVWSALEARLDQLEQAEVDGALAEWEQEKLDNADEMNAVREEGRLADRLRERREGKRAERLADELAPAASSAEAEPGLSRASYLLGRLVELAPKEEAGGAVIQEGADTSLASLPRGVAVRDEWRSLLLACVSWGARSESSLFGCGRS